MADDNNQGGMSGAQQQFMGLLASEREPVPEQQEQQTDAPVEPVESVEAEDQAYDPAQEIEEADAVKAYEDEQDQVELEEPADEPVEQSFTITIDGKDETVSAEELSNGYLRQRDYTRKTQAVAEDRKAVASEREALQAERQQLQAAMAQALDNLHQDPLLARTNDDWNKLREEDPFQYQQEWTDMQRKREEVMQRQQQMAQVQAHQMREYVQREGQRLLERFPQWTDSNVRLKGEQTVAAACREAGFTDQEIASIGDHRFVALAHLAGQFLEGQKAQKEVKAKVKAKPKTKAMKPGAAKEAVEESDQAKKALERLKKKGGVQAGADWFLASGIASQR